MSIKVQGLKELTKDLRRLDSDGPWRAELRDAGKGAAEIVATTAKRTAMSASNPRMGSRAAGSIRALAGQRRAAVAGGRASIPWYGGHEFGSRKYAQFPPKRKDGYHLWPAAEKERPKVVEFYTDAVDDLMKKHGL